MSGRHWAQRFSSTSRVRAVLDVGWCLAFAATLALIAIRPSKAVSTDDGIELDLVPGTQTHGIYRRGVRLGDVQWRVRRRGRQWLLDHRFTVRGHQAARIRQWLRADLSLARLDLRADISRLEGLSSYSGFVLKHLRDFHKITLRGDCAVETGTCMVGGRVGKHPVQFSVTAGRGPVDTSAVYRLMARGSLGKEAELSIFDPLALRQRLVTFRILGQERLVLASGTFSALVLQRDLDGLNTRVWIDREGKVLKEELPLGFVLEHEGWSAESDDDGKR